VRSSADIVCAARRLVLQSLEISGFEESTRVMIVAARGSVWFDTYRVIGPSFLLSLVQVSHH
jgi:hypothetical protein